jgi:hypothetical protein
MVHRAVEPEVPPIAERVATLEHDVADLRRWIQMDLIPHMSHERTDTILDNKVERIETQMRILEDLLEKEMKIMEEYLGDKKER